ncbi:cyclin-F-like, partial [Python bivittatus]|uniref:Cyclin-F-like n=1 Tax=Python bivittatus TaxID=176946 RepID=A0A9F2WIH3_PYTBI
HPWTSQLTEITGFSLEELVPCVLSLHKKCFHEDVPKDYRQVSLTAVKQRFEDKRYEEIGKEEVMSYSQLCSLLGVKQEDPEPGSSYVNAVETFLTSPSGKRSKRRREDSIQEDRGSFVTTPTAELSNQEESLLDNFLDWSLDACSGYEGDQESEGEKDGDVTAPTGILDGTLAHLDPGKPCCCQESSDEESLSKEGCQYIFKHYDQPNEGNECPTIQTSPREASSGYASVNSTSPPSATDGPFRTFPKASSVQPLRLARDKTLPLPSRSESCLHSAGGQSGGRQAKRKNVTEYIEEEKNSLGFLSL